MRTAGIMILAVMAFLATGCASGPAARYQEMVCEAREHLVEGQWGYANSLLAKSQAFAAEEELQDTECRLLQAEAKLQAGDTVAASNVVQGVMVQDGSNPRAHEVLGKVLLREGRYAEADQQFVAAKVNYRRASDRQRASDLLQLSQGLAAYASGDRKVAEAYWREIRSAELRYSVDKAAGAVRQRLDGRL